MVNILGFELPIGDGISEWLNLSSASVIMMYALAFFIFLVGILIIFYVFLDMRLYKYKIRDFENTGSGYRLVEKDKARLVKIGDGGEEVLYLKKRKIYRSAYGRKMGTNEYWFAKGQDGYFYNILLGDLDAKMGMLDIEPIDRDMRYMHVALRKNAEMNYKKTGFMDKYGQQIFNGILLIIFFIGMWFMMDSFGGVITESKVFASELARTVEPIREALARVDTICSGGSGLA